MKRFVLFFLSFLISIPAWSMIHSKENENIGIELSFDTGIRTGLVHEYVIYYLEDKNLSRLNWQTKAFPTIELGARLDIYNVIFGTSFLTSFPMDCGTMEDNDWDTYPSDAPEYRTGKLTNFSQQDLKINHFVEAKFLLGYQFKLQPSRIGTFSLTPHAGFFYRHYKFNGHDGYGIYDEYDNQRITQKGTAITYEQETKYLSAGLEVNWNFKKDFNVKLSGSYAPYVFCKSIDTHHFMKYGDSKFEWVSTDNSYNYKDTMNGGYAFSIGTQFSWKSVAIGISYDYMKEHGGETIINTPDGTSTNVNVLDYNYRTYPGTDQSFLTVSVKFIL